MSAANNPTITEIYALGATLQQEIAVLRQQQTQQPVAPAANPVVFADTPQMLEVENLINYGTKRGAKIYKQGCAPLDDKSLTDWFNMIPNQVITFIKAFQRHCTEMGWNTRNKNITSFTNRDGNIIDIIKNYGQINEATLRTACERFCSAAGANSRTRAKQNNLMMSICLAKFLTADAQARLLIYRKDYLIGDVECTPLMYKVIMHLATIDSIATTQELRDNLHALGVFASTGSGDIDKINAEFDKNYSQIIARGTTVDNPIGMLFAAFQVVPCFNFRTYINRMQENYLDGKHPTMMHESLMGMAKSKFNYLRNMGTWGTKSLDDDKIVVMTAAINKLKGQLNLLPQLAAVAAKGDKDKKKM
jgi:hypothetical protein